MEKGLLVLFLTSGMLGPAPAHADVNIGITVAPPPQIVVATPPRLTVVPGSAVYYAPGVDYNLFVYNGRYYSFHDGVWFYAPTSHAKWMVIGHERVPRPVLAVPVHYYRVPPGHARKMVSDVPPGHDKERGDKEHGGKKAKGKRGHDD